MDTRSNYCLPTHSLPWTVNLTQPLKSQKPTNWNNPKHTQITPIESTNHRRPLQKFNHHIHKSHSPMRTINPQPRKISSQFQSHHINLITEFKVPQLQIERTLCCLSPPSPCVSFIQNQLMLQGWVSPWGLMWYKLRWHDTMPSSKIVHIKGSFGICLFC